MLIPGVARCVASLLSSQVVTRVAKTETTAAVLPVLFNVQIHAWLASFASANVQYSMLVLSEDTSSSFERE